MVERFDQSAVEHSKRSLWESCKGELEGAGLVYHQRCGSDKKEQIDADLEDILAAFDALDAKSSIPPIYCEAIELPKIPVSRPCVRAGAGQHKVTVYSHLCYY